MSDEKAQATGAPDSAASALSAGLDWCPTQAGTYRAYVPEYLDGEKWREVQTIRGVGGVPQPLCYGGINQTVGLFGHAQAWALAWAAAAAMAAEGCEPKVRVVPYEVRYDIKARRLEESN